MKEDRIEQLYYNPIQAQYALSKAKRKVLIGARGLGKSTINAHESSEKVKKMPRSRGLFLCLTYNQALTKTLPPVIQMWEKLGLVRNQNYYIGRKPPEKLNWKSAYMPPQKFENIISFWNGSVIDIGSFDRKDHLRGGSYDWVMVDEAGLISIDRYNTEIKTSLRPSSILLTGKEGHLSESFTSSMPWLDSGYWLLELGEQYQREQEYLEKVRSGLLQPDPNYKPLNLFYIEGTSWHNRKVLGDDTINYWKETLPPLIYAVECLNKKKKKGNGTLFYPALNETVHFYHESFNYDYYDAFDFRIDRKSINSRGDADCDPYEPLNLSFDFGGFNSFTVDQEKWPFVRFLKNFYTKDKQILDDIVDEFIKYYSSHQKRTVNLYGDKSGNKKQENSKTTLYEDIEKKLKGAGWRVIRKKMGDVEHLARHRFFNILLREQDPRLPKLRINQNNCKELIISMENTNMKDNKKDKTSERKDIPQQTATHLSDCIDYRMYHAYASKIEGTGTKVRAYEIATFNS